MTRIPDILSGIIFKIIQLLVTGLFSGMRVASVQMYGTLDSRLSHRIPDM